MRKTNKSSKETLRRAAYITALVAFALFSLPGTATSQAKLERLFYYVDRQDSYESLTRNIDAAV